MSTARVWMAERQRRLDRDLLEAYRIARAGRAVERLNLYFADRVEKWYRVQAGGKGGWEHHTDDGERAWPTPWRAGDGTPLGIPVVHFRNKPLGKATGRSELRGVIPQIDLLNKLVVDLAAILDNQAWRQRWATGIDGTGSQFTNVPGDVWTSSSPDAHFGDFAADEAAGVLAAIDQTLNRMARRSRTPLHLLTGGDMPSGEALKSAESGQTAKAKKIHVVWGNGWEDAMLYALRLTEAYGSLPVEIDLSRIVITTEWDDPVSRNDKEEAETALLYHELGVSKDTILTRLGFDPEHEAEQRRLEGAGADDTLARLLDHGAGMGGTAVPPPPAATVPALTGGAA
jgi:SPP1 Gp6-like portal protein